MPMPIGESAATALFIMLVVFMVLILLWGLISLFTRIIAMVMNPENAAKRARRRPIQAGAAGRKDPLQREGR
ncbi:MAG: OadG family protein [Oscillospiraceae bacterium]|nr:OadG family protein [Oscillospiraceae bacterium]